MPRARVPHLTLTTAGYRAADAAGRLSTLVQFNR